MKYSAAALVVTLAAAGISRAALAQALPSAPPQIELAVDASGPLTVRASGDERTLYAVRLHAASRTTISARADGGAQAAASLRAHVDGANVDVYRSRGSHGGLLVHLDVGVKCCAPVTMRISRGSLRADMLRNAVDLHVESGSLTIDTRRDAPTQVSASVENGSLTATLANPPLGGMIASLENGPPDTWSSGTSIAVPDALRSARHATAHGARVRIGDPANAAIHLSVTNGLMTLALAPAPIAGISCDPMEGSAMHLHAVVRIVDRGRLVELPSDIGRPAGAGCFYWVHTHAADDIVHVESPVVRSFDLGDLFAVWGEPLDRSHVGPLAIAPHDPIVAYVNGKRWNGPMRTIPLLQYADIQLVIGAHAVPLPAFTAWGSL